MNREGIAFSTFRLPGTAAWPILLNVPKAKKPAGKRIDLLLVEKGLAESQPIAQALVLAGKVTAAGNSVVKPGTVVPEDAELAVVGREPFVGRGGVKLDYALDAFQLDVSGKMAVDIGSSTGGFTDCLLQRGAAKVYAVDVGKGQLDWRLRKDTRVVVREGANARYPLDLPEAVDLAVIDVSFISVTKVVPSAAAALKLESYLVVLVKPQFEAERREVARGGVVREPELHAKVLGRFINWATGNRFRVCGLARSPIVGAEGNTEFFVLLRKD